MKVIKELNRIMLYMSPDEFTALEDAFEPVDRIVYEPLFRQGLDNYALDFPNFKIIAVLDPELLK